MTKNYYKSKYNRVYGDTVAIKGGRAAWPYLVTPRENTFPVKAGDPIPAPRFEITVVLPKSDPKVQALVKAMAAESAGMLATYNEGKKSGKLAECPAFKDGDDFDHEKYPYYKDCYLALCRNASKPATVGANKQAIPADTIKGGNLVNVLATPHLGPEGISWKVETVQLVKDDGVKFAGSYNKAALLSMLDGDGPDEEVEAPEAEEVEEDMETPSEEDEEAEVYEESDADDDVVVEDDYPVEEEELPVEAPKTKAKAKAPAKLAAAPARASGRTKIVDLI